VSIKGTLLSMIYCFEDNYWMNNHDELIAFVAKLGICWNFNLCNEKFFVTNRIFSSYTNFYIIAKKSTSYTEKQVFCWI
jgi:hypothetical protein